jgi:CheY-like chemotaxis protein
MDDQNKTIEPKLPLVLLVENEKISSDITYLYLKDVCRMDFAYTGEDALKMVREKDYTAILMDIHLGIGINGVELTKIIRAMKEYETKPIIAITAYAMMKDREAFLQAGCSHYISKPFEKKELVALIKEALNISK